MILGENMKLRYGLSIIYGVVISVKGNRLEERKNLSYYANFGKPNWGTENVIEEIVCEVMPVHWDKE